MLQSCHPAILPLLLCRSHPAIAVCTRLARFVQNRGTSVATMTNDSSLSSAATSAVLFSLIVRSLGLATGIGIAILLAAALFSG